MHSSEHPGQGPRGAVRRPIVLAVFGLFIWGAAFFSSWAQTGSTPADERTFETSRRGFQPIDYPGPVNVLDMMRLLMRHEGNFHMPLTRSFREWRLAPMADLWELNLPQALKIRVSDGRAEFVHVPARLRLGVHETYNLPVIFRNDRGWPVEVKLIGTLGSDGPTDRFHLQAGLTYGVFNLRPTDATASKLDLKFHAGQQLPAEGSPPESVIKAEAAIPAEVVEWGTLRLRTTEGRNPVAARVYLWASDGLAYAPEDVRGRPSTARITWTHGDYFFYSSGDHEIRVPAGRVKLEAVRGIEYRPAVREINVAAGRTTDVSLRLERLTDFASEGWYGGDVHIHANYNNHEFITPADIRGQALAEDLNVANLVVANSGDEHIHDEQYFEGRPHKLSGPRHILYWVEEMRNNGPYGHMCLTGLKSLVKPLYTGFRDTPYPYDYPPNHVQALAATNQGGAASYAHPGYNFTDDPQTMSARELPVDLALGSVQAMDVMSNSNEDGSTPYWYRLLNTGLKCSISAGTDSFTNRRHHWIPGGHRVFVDTGRRLEYQAWVDQYRNGRSFATNGPMLRFSVNGRGPGAELNLKSGDEVTIEASATSFVPMEKIEIVVNGDVVATAAAASGGLSARLSQRVELTEGSWIAARVRGPFHRYLVNDTYLYAHSSPVYCTVDGRKVRRKQDGEFFVAWIDKLIGSANQRGRYASEAQRQEVIKLFRRGQDYYRKVANGVE